MKTITTQLVKNISLAIFISIISVTSVTAANDQTNPVTSPVTNLSVAVINNNVFINWNMTEGAAADAYCEVQASKDGKNFTTIGFVMGANPSKTDNTFSFKQQQAKIKPGMIYFRVLNVIAADKAISSAVVKLN